MTASSLSHTKRPLRARPLACLFGLCFCLLLLMPGRGAAADMEISIGVGGSVNNTPYRSHDLQWMPWPFINLEHDYFYIRGYNLGAKILDLEFLEFSAFVGYDDTRYDPSDSDDWDMRRLKNRYSSALLGLEARVKTPYGMLVANAARDILGVSDGYTGEIGYKYSWEIGKFELIPAVGTYWSSGDYNDYYYGVSSWESGRSGMDAYKAGGGFSPYVGLGVDFSVTDNFDIFCNAEVTFLSDEIRHSPMVNKDHTQKLSVGVSYTF